MTPACEPPADGLSVPALGAVACQLLGPDDFAAVAALDLAAQQQSDPAFGQLPQREQDARLSSSEPALKFYGRTGHSFVAWAAGQAVGFALAQSVWQGDRPIVLVRCTVTDPSLPGEQGRDVYDALLRAVFKSAYDTAVYDVHFVPPAGWVPSGDLGRVRQLGTAAVRYLGSREETAPGPDLASYSG